MLIININTKTCVIDITRVAQLKNTFEGHKGRPGKRGGSLPREIGKDKYLKDGKGHIFENFIEIHKKAGLIEDAPDKFWGKTKEDIYKVLKMDKNGWARIPSPVETIKINKLHISHLIEENEKERKHFLNYTLLTIERPNLILSKENKNTYIKLFKSSEKIKPHLQIVKVASDGSFYVTNFRPSKNRVAREIIEGRVVYDPSSIREKGVP